MSQVPFDWGRKNEVSPIDGLHQRPVLATALVECPLKVSHFNSTILKGGNRCCLIDQTAEFRSAPAWRTLCKGRPRTASTASWRAGRKGSERAWLRRGDPPESSRRTAYPLPA